MKFTVTGKLGVNRASATWINGAITGSLALTSMARMFEEHGYTVGQPGQGSRPASLTTPEDALDTFLACLDDEPAPTVSGDRVQRKGGPKGAIY